VNGAFGWHEFFASLGPYLASAVGLWLARYVRRMVVLYSNIPTRLAEQDKDIAALRQAMNSVKENQDALREIQSARHHENLVRFRVIEQQLSTLVARPER
jgi:hypothetical protein